jgi:hypothetical protein
MSTLVAAHDRAFNSAGTGHRENSHENFTSADTTAAERLCDTMDVEAKTRQPDRNSGICQLRHSHSRIPSWFLISCDTLIGPMIIPLDAMAGVSQNFEILGRKPRFWSAKIRLPVP